MITVLTGENTFAIRHTYRRLVKEFSGEVERLDGTAFDLTQLPDIFAGSTLFSEQRMVVISDASLNKPLWSALEQWIGKVPEETHIVFIESHIDKRTKTYKLLVKQASIIEHELPDDASLLFWLQSKAREHEVDMPTDIARYLVQYVGKDQWRLMGELEKLILADRQIDRALIQEIAEPYPEASAFELLDSAFAGKFDRAEELLALLAEREDPYRFLGLLSSQVIALLALCGAGQRRPDEVARDIGLHPYAVRRLSPIASRLGRSRATRLLGALADCDYRIKTSAVDPWQQLKKVILTI